MSDVGNTEIPGEHDNQEGDVDPGHAKCIWVRATRWARIRAEDLEGREHCVKSMFADVRPSAPACSECFWR